MAVLTILDAVVEISVAGGVSPPVDEQPVAISSLTGGATSRVRPSFAKSDFIHTNNVQAALLPNRGLLMFYVSFPSVPWSMSTPSMLKARLSQTKSAKARPRRPVEQRHPLLFTLMTLTAAAELGLTAFLISAGGSVGTWGSSGYQSLLILLFFEAIWTLVFAAAYLLWVIHGGAAHLANTAGSVIWLLLTAVFWGAAAGFIHSSRSGGDCTRTGPISRCRQSQTVEALGWIEFSLCILTLFTTVLWMITGVKVRLRDSRTFV